MLKTLRSVLRFRAIELDGNVRRLNRAINIDEMRGLARRRLPRGVFDYIDGGADDELSMRRNAEGFGNIDFCPRVLRDMDELDASTTLLGKPLPFPLVLAPTGMTRMVSPNGELDVARAAQQAGIPYSLSTMGTRSIEEVAAVNQGAKWFQVYVWKDRGLVKELLQRAAEAGYETILITVDTATVGNRERDVRHGFTAPPKIGLETIVDGLLHPFWTWKFITSEPMFFANVVGNEDLEGSDAVVLSKFCKEQFDSSLAWRDIEWFQQHWKGPIIIKGIQSVEDAKLAVQAGIPAIAVSNHGGRQLDSAPPSIELIEPIADAVGADLEIICDGGVRRGSDIVKAIALGADACMIGRPYLYGLAVAGQRGVERTIEHLREGMIRTLALTGCGNVAGITRDLISFRG